MAFDTNTLTLKGAELLASATAADRLIIVGCDATTTYLTEQQAQAISLRPSTPASNTTTVTQLGATAEHVMCRAYFRAGDNTGGDVNTLYLYGYRESAPSDIYVVYICSSQTAFHLPVVGDVIDEYQPEFDIVYTLATDSVGFATQATYNTQAEFNLLKERTVTTHKEGAQTTGEAQTIYGDKTFEDKIIFISPNNWKMTLGHDGFKIVDSVDVQKTKIDPSNGIITTTGSIISNSTGVYSTFYNLNVTNNLSVGKDVSADTFTCGEMSWEKQVQNGTVTGGYLGLLDINGTDKSYIHAWHGFFDYATLDIATTRAGQTSAQIYLGGATNSESATTINMKIREPNDSGMTGLSMAWDAVKLCYAATFDMPVTFDENIYPQKSINLSGNQAKVVSTNSGGTQTALFYDGTIDMTGGYIRISDSNRARLFADPTGIYAYSATDGSLVFSVNSDTSAVTVNSTVTVSSNVYLGTTRKTSISQSIIGTSTILNITMPSESTGHNYIQVMDAEITIDGVVNVDDNVLNVLDSNGDAAVVLSPQGVNLEHAGTTTAVFSADTGNLSISGKMTVGDGLFGIAPYKDSSNNLVIPIGGPIVAFFPHPTNGSSYTLSAGDLVDLTESKYQYGQPTTACMFSDQVTSKPSIAKNIPTSYKYRICNDISVGTDQGSNTYDGVAILIRVE